MFCSILVVRGSQFGSRRCFWRGHDGDKPLRTVRCQVLLTEYNSIAWSTASNSTVLDLTDLAESPTFLQAAQNFFNHLASCSFLFCATNVFGCSHYSTVRTRKSSIPKLDKRCTFNCAVFKSHTA